MLTQQLRDLERDGIIHRMVYAVVPLKLDYSLTDYGQTLNPLLHLRQCVPGKQAPPSRNRPARQNEGFATT